MSHPEPDKQMTFKERAVFTTLMLGVLQLLCGLLLVGGLLAQKLPPLVAPVVEWVFAILLFVVAFGGAALIAGMAVEPPDDDKTPQ